MANTTPTITHLLGYLTPEQWADALKTDALDKDEIKDLIKEQERIYDFDLMRDVDEILK